MSQMFSGADLFDQNLGNWYIILDDKAIAHNDTTRAIGSIGAQNQFLDGQNSTYYIGSGWDSGFFDITGSVLKLKVVPDHSVRSAYTVNITATDPSIFGSGNSRILNITITPP